MTILTDPSHLDRFIDRHLQVQEVRRRLGTQTTVPTSQPGSRQGPWITVSRQVGSGGNALAHALSERIGWQIFDRQILDEVARQTHVRERILSRLDEHALSSIADFASHLIVPGHPGRAGFLVELTRVIGALGLQGNAILIGRGANWILGPQNGLRVRMVAPLEFRIEKVAAQEGISLEAARKRAEADDNDRAQFVRQSFRRDINDPLGYDLVLNGSTLTAEAAAEITLVALKGKCTGIVL